MYGLSIGLGFAGTIEVYTNSNVSNLLQGYRNALYLAIGFAGAGMIGSLLFLRIPKNVKEGSEEDNVSEKATPEENTTLSQTAAVEESV